MIKILVKNTLYIGMPIVLYGTLRLTGIGIFLSAIISILTVSAIGTGHWILEKKRR